MAKKNLKNLIKITIFTTIRGFPVASLNQIKIISYKEKDDWELTVKYNIGKK